MEKKSLLEALGYQKKSKKITTSELKTILLEEYRLWEQEEKENEEPQVTGDPGKDLEAAYNAGPEGVRAFMDAQGNKDPAVQDALVKAAEANDGADPDDKISVSSAEPVAVGDLGPTQQFIDLMQSVSFPLGSADVLEKAITSKTSGAHGTISISGGAV